MRRALLTALVASAIALPSAAMAAVLFDEVGDDATIMLGGDYPGTSGSLYLELTGLDANGDFTFDYTLTNTSDLSQNPFGRISSFGFSTTPNLIGATIVDGEFTNFTINPGGGQLANVEICFANSGGSCSGPGGATVANPAEGTFTLDFASGTGSVTLDDFGSRLQSLGVDGEDSGRAYQVPAVPEPGTWAMMLVGFGGIGFAMRRRRRSGPLAQQLA